jgi:hypothetical protein
MKLNKKQLSLFDFFKFMIEFELKFREGSRVWNWMKFDGIGLEF